ncbi:MAG: sucrose phosphorylase [Dactylosporangium sp.]|nr:sucrose phosphorylase [Dactylosporangium sp.]
MRNQPQLITYADRLGGGLDAIQALLSGPLAGLFGGVHLLPFYTPFDGADAGFDPTDHTTVDPRLGSWTDIQRLAKTHDVVADFIVNHVSRESREFSDLARHGAESAYAGMFLTFDAVYPEGATEQDLLSVYRPRPGLPFVPVRWGGQRRLAWSTFTPAQIDVDVRHPQGQAYLDRVLGALTSNGVSLLRLDAVGYAVKTPGTSSFMTPDTLAFIAELTERARDRGVEILVEVHGHYSLQIAVAEQVDWVYDFALPPLILHALFTGDARVLGHWLEIRPANAVTVLDTHDGIGVVDVGPTDFPTAQPGLLSADDIDILVNRIHDNSEQTSRAATGLSASNLDIYQVNCTYYDALGRDDDAYLIARALQLFTPGIPQIYYVGLLAGTNDVDLLTASGVGRDINRGQYTAAEIEAQLRRPVVRDLIRLIRLRAQHRAFAGTCQIRSEDTTIAIEWTNDTERATLTVDFAARTMDLAWTDGSTPRQMTRWPCRDA